MAHKKAGGSTSNVRDSGGKRLGVKLFGGEAVREGGIIIRQRGTKFRPGKNTYLGRDFTIHAKIAGAVQFREKQLIKFNGRKENCMMVNVVKA
jgi:large subunit ribosomal protein L27